MFRVLIEEYSQKGTLRKFDVVMKTEKLFEALGRYTVRMGVPSELYNEGGMVELEFYMALEKGGWVAATISYARIAKDQLKTPFSTKPPSNVSNLPVTVTPPTQPKSDLPLDDRLKTMLDKGVLQTVA